MWATEPARATRRPQLKTVCDVTFKTNLAYTTRTPDVCRDGATWHLTRDSVCYNTNTTDDGQYGSSQLRNPETVPTMTEVAEGLTAVQW